MTDNGEDQGARPDDLCKGRLRFAQPFLRHLEALGRPFLPPGQPPVTAADYLKMLALGELLAGCDHSWAADPGAYRDPAYLHGALTAGATWGEIAAAIGEDQAGPRCRYRHWADGQHQRAGVSGGPGDDQYAAAIKRAEGEG
jgi:hypothetical protein